MRYVSGFLSVFVVLLVSLTTLPSAKADQGTYISLWGGYLDKDAPDVEGYSIGNPFNATFGVSPDEGGFFGAAFGAPLSPGTFIFNHIEIYFEGQITETDSSRFDSNMGTNIAIPTVGGFGRSSFSAMNAFVVSEIERDRYEFGSKLAIGDQFPALGGANLSIIAFTGFGNENLDTLHQEIGGMLDFDITTVDLDWLFSGLMLGTNVNLPLSTNVALIISGAAGVYYFDADADFVTTASIAFPTGQSSDDENGFGFRGQLFGEVRSKLGGGMSLSVFGGVDYWSDAPSTRLTNPDLTLFAPPLTNRIETDDIVDLKAGAKITISLDGP